MTEGQPGPRSVARFSVACNFDDALPAALEGLPVHDLFGAFDRAPIGHGRPRLVTPPVSRRRFARTVRGCRRRGIGFQLLLNPVCLDGQEGAKGLERALRRTLSWAVDIGVTGVTVAHPWVLGLAREFPLETRISVFVGISTIEQAKFWEHAGAHVVVLDTHAVSRDLRSIREIVESLRVEVELPVNIGCLLRCPIARNHAARLSHASRPGAQPIDLCYLWCREEKRRDPVQVVRSDFIRPEDLHRYEALGVHRFKIVDRTCSTEALVTRVQAYDARRWDGDLLDLIGPRGRPPRRRFPPILDAIRTLGVVGTLGALRRAPTLMATEPAWTLDNRALGDLLLPNGCTATHCEACGHCARVAQAVARPRS